MLCDLPNKITTAIGSSLPLYFMTHLRRTPGHFFVFLVFTFACTLTMSMYFRCIAALSRTLAQVRISLLAASTHLTDLAGHGSRVGV